MSNGDIGLVWISGENAGIYATFNIISSAQYLPTDKDELEFWRDQTDENISKPKDQI